jgi:toxin HigB-1
LKVNFKDKKIREMCEKQAVAEKKLGAACARKLRGRLSDLEAAARVTDLAAGNPHPLKGDRQGQFALDLAGGWRLVFAPDLNPCPTRPDGGIDWSQVIIVCIAYIGDYHD